MDWKTYSIVPFKFIDKMVDAINKTAEDYRERGFNICEDKEFNISETVVGKTYEVKLTEECRGRKIGFFHTHPSGYSDLSIGDIYTAMSKGDRVACVGTISDSTVSIDGKLYTIPAYSIKCATFNVDHENFDKYLRKVEDYYVRHRILSLSMKEKDLQRAGEIRKEFDKFLDKMEEDGVVDLIAYGVVVGETVDIARVSRKEDIRPESL